jgi:hypothetical protein
VRCCLLSRFAGGDPLTGLLSATKAEMPRRRQPVRQDRKRLPARTTNPATHPDAFVLVVVRLSEPTSVADDRVLVAERAHPRQQIQQNYPGSMLSLFSGSAIKRITAGVKARR